MRTQQTWIWIVLLACMATASGCRILPPKEFPEAVVETNISDRFFDRVPVDIAVMPVYSEPSDVPPVVGKLRDRIKAELLEKSYSPVSFSSIDSKLGAVPERRTYDLNQIRGNFDEDALLLATLDRWDRSHFVSDHTVIASATFTLYDSRTGDKLWHYRVSDKAVSIPGMAEEDSQVGYEQYISEVLVTEAFEGFPTKDLPTDIRSAER